jgi:hypothetical protein
MNCAAPYWSLFYTYYVVSINVYCIRWQYMWLVQLYRPTVWYVNYVVGMIVYSIYGV